MTDHRAAMVERLVALATADADAAAVDGLERRLTRGELADRAGGLAERLADGTGTVMVLAGDVVDLAVGVVAAVAAGRTFVVADDRDHDGVASIARDVGATTCVSGDGRARAGLETVASDPATAGPLVRHVRAQEGPVAYVATSGSTGRPRILATDRLLRPDATAGELRPSRLRPSDRLLRILVRGGKSVTWLLQPLSLGVPLFAPDPNRVPTSAILSALRDREVTVLRVVPSFLRLLLRTAEVRDATGFRGLRAVLSGGEPLRWEDVHALARLCGSDTVLVHTYGATDVGGRIAELELHPAAGGFPAAGTVPVGRPVPPNTIEILDPAGVSLPSGRSGEVALRGPGLERRTDRSELLPNGEIRVRTGDLGHVDGAGLLHLEGRRDRMVKLAGRRVEPGDAEARAVAVAGVAEACVTVRRVGDRAGLVVHVVAAPGASELEDRVRAAVAPLAVPWAVEVRTDPLPRLATGKVDRRALGDEPTSGRDA